MRHRRTPPHLLALKLILKRKNESSKMSFQNSENTIETLETSNSTEKPFAVNGTDITASGDSGGSQQSFSPLLFIIPVCVGRSAPH